MGPNARNEKGLFMSGNSKRARLLLLILLLCPCGLRAFAAEIPARYLTDWQDELGLWGKNPQIRDQAWMLAAAALDGLLDKINTTKVLQNLRIAQEKDGPYRGCFWWQWSDRKITDTNSGFFTTLGLLTLLHAGHKQLNYEQRSLLDELLSEARHWFDRETRNLESHLRYPNKCLGDVVCMWLVAEHFGEPSPEQHEILNKTLAYYRDSPWGWGEHMSDIYARVLQDQLVALYMWGRSLSCKQRQEVWELFLELVAIDDIFDPGPRVPVIRSYTATSSPSPIHYRALLVAWDPKSAPDARQPLRALACANNIATLLPEKPEPPRYAEVPCYGGAHALVTRADAWRLGAMSWYPIMEGIDHRTWGLAWQSMPVAYWRSRGDWGFLQWESVVNGSVRTHPQPYSSSFGGAPKSLADRGPGMLGRTYATRRGDGFVVLRRCARSDEWTSFKDRFRLIESSAQPTVRTQGDWGIFELDYGIGDNLVIQFLPVIGHGTQVFAKNPYNGYDWEYNFDLVGNEFAALWIILPCTEDPILPAVERNGSILTLKWPKGDLRYLQIDLTSADPTQVLKWKSPQPHDN